MDVVGAVHTAVIHECENVYSILEFHALYLKARSIKTKAGYHFTQLSQSLRHPQVLQTVCFHKHDLLSRSGSVSQSVVTSMSSQTSK